ncbi:hypothetical protein ACA910_013383 [Epithemia clementina (nom. ined.)]
MKNRKPSKSNRIPILIFLTVVGFLFVWFGNNKTSNDDAMAVVESSSTLRSLSSTSSSSTSPPLTSKVATTTPEYEDYALASNHTYEFFNDIPTKEWKRIQRNVKAMQPNECPNCPGGKYTNAWFQNNYEPEISCRHEQRIGKLGDGGKWVCDPHRITEKQDCLVYSVGSNNDFSFEEHVFATIGSHCEIHTFDPADYSAQAERVRNQMKTLSSQNMNLHYHQWGIAGENQGDQYLTVNETVHRLGHVGRTIDIFKIDCEGCELSSFNTWVGLHEDTIRLMQVLVEVHARKDHIQRGVEEFFEGMHKHGYAIFHKEPNIHYWTSGPVAAVEYGYLKLAPEFFA